MAASEGLHGWYSFKEAKRNGVRVHRADDGGEVPVTHTAPRYDAAAEMPLDAIYVGVVGALLSEINCGLFYHERLTEANTDPYPETPTRRPPPQATHAELSAAVDILWVPEGLRGAFATGWDDYDGVLPPALRHITGAVAADYVSRALAHYRDA